MNQNTKYLFFLVFCCLCVGFSYAQNAKKKDTIVQKKDTVPIRFDFRHHQTGGLYLKYPSEIRVVYEKLTDRYVFEEKIGKYFVRTPIFMTPEEYKAYRFRSDIIDYFKEKIRAREGKLKNDIAKRKNLLPTYYVNSKFFQSLFGGNKIDITPTGNINFRLGAIYQNTENPQISEQNRSSLTFDFDQQINAGLVAQIGERVRLEANYDTQTTFDFQNFLKLEYTPSEDDIVQGIEIGNVTMPIKNSLITGAQALFGVKSKFQFGKTNITAVFSQQNSESNVVTSEAGASIQEFNLRATDYDDDRHFFLSQYFRENYARSLKNYPLISSPINITRIEVWITNRNASVEDFRNIVALADIGETRQRNLVSSSVVPDPNSPSVVVNVNGVPTNVDIPANQSNNIFPFNSNLRDISTVDNYLQGSFGMNQGVDYSILQNARKLQTNEYTLNNQLGYISLNRRLNDGEVLAVAYEYTVVGASAGETSFKVGEFSNDGIDAPNNLAVKLLRSEILTTKRTNNNTGLEEPFPTWNLMMKNIYALGAFPLERDGFLFELQYRDDQTGIPSNTLQNAQTPNIANTPLIQVFDLDRLDQTQFQSPDGFFDYVEGITVNSQNGYIIFPDPEPFGSGLEEKLTASSDVDFFVFDELYLDTKINVQFNNQEKDKFFLRGYFKSQNSGGIPIGAFNVPRGSVTVTAGGRQLVEGVDYVVDYQAGRVQIIDPGLESSGIPIQVSTENNLVFNQQRKTFMGIDVEHRFSDDFIIGGTLLNVQERPLTPKINFGSEPINNTMLGFNLDYSSEVPYLTKLVNKLPFVETEAPSNISVRADMAYLLPGSPSGIDVSGQATAYIDDFEASQIPITLLNPLQWFTASTPRGSSIDFNGDATDLSYNYKRSLLAWYNIDPIFYGLGNTPGNIDADALSRDETRQINFSELFPNQELDVTQQTLVRTLDLAFFPHERAPYNFDTGPAVNIDGTFTDPEERWAGIMRPLNTNNFEQANVEYIQFWLMDPYKNYSLTTEEGVPVGVNPLDPSNQVGELYFHLGNVSEDILRDNRKMYENGLPADGSLANTTQTNWGNIPTNPSIIYAFDEDDLARTNQDVGLDGLNDLQEDSFFRNLSTTQGLNIDFSKLNPIDIASDNYLYYRGSEQDANDASVISRYKLFNNTQGNSPTLNQSTEAFPTSATTYPDVEDINRDQTMNTVESYFEYKISMNRNDLVVGQNFIVDKKDTPITLENGNTQTATWYQFRIPIRSGGTPVNGITDFNSIRFIRMVMSRFKMPVVLRFGEIDLVRGDWRRYTRTLDPTIVPAQPLAADELNSFEVGVVNIEQNESRYILPPGIVRERLQGSTTVQQQNEQSVAMIVNDLEPDKTRAIFKNITIDLRRYNNLEMFLHNNALVSGTLNDDDFTAIVRVGTDLNDNFYQLEIPLKVSPNGTLDPQLVWPEANNLKVAMAELGGVKLERDGANASLTELYTSSSFNDPNQLVIRVKGNPTLAIVRTVMLGIKNNSNVPRSGEVWFNELRASGFDNEGGWAAVVSADANFADVGTVSVTGRIQTVGFGNVEDRVSQRSLDETKQYDVTTSVDLGKMMPKKWGIQLPFNYSIGEQFIDPKFDPQYQDVELQDAFDVNPNSQFSRDYTKRRSISFVNVRKNRDPKSEKKPKPYDPENFSVTYSYNEESRRNYNIERATNQNVTASASYSYNFQPKVLEPFKNSTKLNSKYLKFIKDLNFNPIPTSLALNTRINRTFNQQQSRNLVEGLTPQPRLRQRTFLFDWDYTVAFDFTKSLSVNFNANNSFIYDNFGSGDELEIFDNFFNTGRPNNYNHSLNATYDIPIDKIPYLKFLDLDYTYAANFNWSATSQDPTIVSQVGNLIQNSNTHNFNSTFNFERLYKDTKLEKLFVKNKKTNNRSKNPFGGPGTPQVNTKKKLTIKDKIFQGIYDVITSVKTGKISYSENNGQLLPGYEPEIGFLGRNSFGGGLAPTFGFVFGSQVDIRQRALVNGWLVAPRADGEDYFDKTYSRTHYNKLDYNFSLEPTKDLNIEFVANRINTRNLTQQLDIRVDPNDPNNEEGFIDTEIPSFVSGNFSTTYSMFNTAFKDPDALFQEFRANRQTIADRLAAENPGLNPDGFGLNSQQVMLPAFMSAYGGKNPDKVNLGLFRNIPIPNWNVRYSGLMKYKWFKDNFSSFVVSHGYNSSYTVSNFTNNLLFNPNDLSIRNAANNYEPNILVSSVTLVDEFNPLVKVDMKMKNSFSFRGEVRRQRTLTMNFNNSTLTDIKGTEFVLGLGYVIKDVKLKTSFTGKPQTLKGDINLRADISLRDDITLIRSVDTENDQVSGGQKLFSLKVAADYRLSSNLTASFYYDHQTSRYAISTTFPRQAINAGFNIIYNLGN